MAEVTEKSSKKSLDILLWVLLLALIGGGLWVNYHYEMIDISLRIIGWIVLVIVCLGIGYLTSQGRQVWVFAKAARDELRKVVWPNRQETVRTTMVVLALVIVLSLIIWGLDSFLFWIIGLLTGQRG